MPKKTSPRETLLRIRKLEEDIAKAELAEHHRGLQQAAARLEAGHAQYQDAAQRCGEATGHDEFRRAQAAAQAAAGHIIRLETARDEATDAVATAREHAIAASRRTSGIERLVERDKEIQRAESLAADQRTAEESKAGTYAKGRP